jgi:hypothetical protein
MDNDERIRQLEAQVAELSRVLEHIRNDGPAPARPAPAADEPTTSPVETDSEPTTASRGGMLKLAGAAAAGAVAAVATNALPAAAADTDALQASVQVSTSSGTRLPTSVIYTNSATPQVTSLLTNVDANIFLARDEPGGLILFNGSSSSYPAASAGYSYSTVANGVYGYTAMSGAGVVGYGTGTGAVGVLARGAGANLELYPNGAAAPGRSDAHRLGQIVCDSAGDVWLCVAAGTPGTFRKIGGAATAGAFHALAPGRVYDSRAAAPSQGTIAGGQNRTISVADKRDPATGAVTTANFVPAGATAVAANVTVVSQTGAGFLTLNPGGTTAVESSTINWSAAGQILANGVILTLNANRELTVVAGGGGSTDFLIDISGYYL